MPRRPPSPLLAILVLLAAMVIATPGPGTAQATTTQIHLNPTSGPPGTFTRVTGIGFQPNESIDIYEDSYVFYTVQADGTGAFYGYRIRIRDFFGPVKIRIRAVGQSSGLSDQVYFPVHTNWAQFHSNAQHDADNEFENLIRPDNVDALVERWMGVTNTASPSSVVQVDGLVYVNGSNGLTYAFAENGCGAPVKCSPIWTAPPGGQGTPAIGFLSVFVASASAGLTVLDARSGELRWTGLASGELRSSPLVSGTTVFAGSVSGSLEAFDARGCQQPICEPIWTGVIPGEALAAPGASAGIVYVGSRQGLSAFDAAGCGAESCEPLWTTDVGDVSLSSPVISNGVVFTSSSEGTLSAVDAQSGNVLWMGQTGGVGQGTPSIARGLVYVPTSAYLQVFDAEGCGQPVCSTLWHTAPSGGVPYGGAVANGVLFLSTGDDSLKAYAATGCGATECQPIASFPLADGTDPIVTDGLVLVNQAGGVLAFGFPPFR